jgi:hypothetical protein
MVLTPFPRSLQLTQTVCTSGVRIRYISVYIRGGWCVGEAGAWLEVEGDGGADA